jgi:hypothetical protein
MLLLATHSHSHSHSHPLTLTLTHSHTLTHTHTNTHTHTHTHTRVMTHVRHHRRVCADIELPTTTNTHPPSVALPAQAPLHNLLTLRLPSDPPPPSLSQGIITQIDECLAVLSANVDAAGADLAAKNAREGGPSDPPGPPGHSFITTRAGAIPDGPGSTRSRSARPGLAWSGAARPGSARLCPA